MGEGPEGAAHGVSPVLSLFPWSREAPGVLIEAEDLGSLHHLLPLESAMATGPVAGRSRELSPPFCHSLAGTLPSCPAPELNPRSFPACAAQNAAQCLPGAWSQGFELPQSHTGPRVTVLLRVQ